MTKPASSSAPVIAVSFSLPSAPGEGTGRLCCGATRAVSGSATYLPLLMLALAREPERQRRTGVNGASRVAGQIWRHAVMDDRVAPFVERDQLGQQVGTQPVSCAGDPVDLQLHAHRHSPSAHGRGTGSSALW